MKLKDLLSLLEGMSPQEKDNLQQELANKDINSVHRDGKIHVHPDDHSVAKKIAKRLGLEKHIVKNAGINESYELKKAISSGMKDLLKSGDHEGFKRVAKHLGHEEWNTNPSHSDLDGVHEKKLRQAHDHIYKGSKL